MHAPNRTNSRYRSLPRVTARYRSLRLATARYGSLFFVAFPTIPSRLEQKVRVRGSLARANQVLDAESQIKLPTKNVNSVIVGERFGAYYKSAMITRFPRPTVSHHEFG